MSNDVEYFKDRNIEFKHHLMVYQWASYFRPTSVLDLGCGKGPFLFYWNWFCPSCKGVELSQHAVENAFAPNVIQGSITDESKYSETELITAIDVLEHLDDEELSKAMTLISKYGKKFLFSVPVIGDPNLMNDNTHKQFKSKADWERYFESFGIKIKHAPASWLFHHQLFVGEKQ